MRLRTWPPTVCPRVVQQKELQRKESAALIIQKCYRKYKRMADEQERERAARIIQRNWQRLHKSARQAATRSESPERRSDPAQALSPREQQAARTILRLLQKVGAVPSGAPGSFFRQCPCPPAAPKAMMSVREKAGKSNKKKTNQKKKVIEGTTGNRTLDLSHPKRESYH